MNSLLLSRMYPELFEVEEASQLFRAGWVAQFSERLGLDLADAFARHIELFADFFQRVIGVHVDAEAHAQHLGFTRRQAGKYALDGAGETGTSG